MSPQPTLATSGFLLPEEVRYYTLFRISTLAIMDDLSTGSDSDYSNWWVSWFFASKGNKYFCKVEEDYILDCFNLTGLNTEPMAVHCCFMVHAASQMKRWIFQASSSFASILQSPRAALLSGPLVAKFHIDRASATSRWFSAAS